MKITDKLRHWLETESGPWKIGQVWIEAADCEAGYRICHVDDRGREVPETTEDYFRLRHWVRQDGAGGFRALKSEPNLPGGWRVTGLDVRALREALDIIYPTALANFFFWKENRLRVTPFGETAARQTGMYRITASTSPEQKQEVTNELCRTRCLKQRLWNSEAVLERPAEIPLLCPEVCNLFVAACRAKIKGPAHED